MRKVKLALFPVAVAVMQFVSAAAAHGYVRLR